MTVPSSAFSLQSSEKTPNAYLRQLLLEVNATVNLMLSVTPVNEAAPKRCIHAMAARYAEPVRRIVVNAVLPEMVAMAEEWAAEHHELASRGKVPLEVAIAPHWTAPESNRVVTVTWGGEEEATKPRSDEATEGRRQTANHRNVESGETRA